KGGNGGYKYGWQKDAKLYKEMDAEFSTDTITDLGNKLPFGIYSLTVADNQNCSVSQSVPLAEYHNPSVTGTDVIPVACYGERNGEVKVLSLAGTTPMRKCYIKGFDFAYSDSITDLSNSFANLKLGKYQIFASDTLGCLSNNPYDIAVNQPAAPISLVIDNVFNVIGKGTPSGSIQSTAFGGNAGLKEIKLFNSQATCIDSSFRPSEIPFALGSLRAGKYAIHVEDVKGCSFQTDSLWVKEPNAALRFTVTNKQDARCKSQVGSFTVQASGGWGGYRYKRDLYGAFYKRNTFNNLYAGSYKITVQDSLGATFSDSVLVTEPKDNLLSWVSESLLPTCSNNGELKIGIMGGTTPYTLFSEAIKDSLVVPLAQTVSLNGLAAGSHAMRITDGNGCLFDLEATLSDTSMMRVSLAIVYTDNTSGGAIQASVRGGVQPFTYQWKKRFGASLPDNSALLSNQPSGHYSIRVTGNEGCSKDTSIYLPGVSDARFAIAKLGNETSLLAQNGFCKLTSKFKAWKSFDLISPANERLEFNPSDSTTLFYCKGDTVSLQNLAGGSYFISGITAGDTTVYANFTIEPYRPFLFRSINVVNVDTIGGATGEVVVVVTGGGGGNIFEWSRVSGSGSGVPASQNYPESSTLRSLTAGKYRVLVTDRYGNTIVDTATVEAPSASLSISIAEQNNESCKTYKDANVTLKAEGGWGDYQFRHDNTAHYVNGNFFDTLNVRKHYFYLTDKMGVVDSVAIEIAEPDYLTSAIALVDSVNCKGAADGRVEFTVNGGTAPYRFAYIDAPAGWKPGTVATGIAAGEYHYLFTDANSCVGQDTVLAVMHEPDSLLFKSIDITHTTCNTDNGKVKVSLQGGTRPYTYAWRNFSNDLVGTDSTATALMRNGLYTLDVYDYHNCYQHTEKRIKPSTNPAVTDVDTTAVLCFGGNTGTAFITGVKPGDPFAPYSFVWSNADTGRVANGYSQGVHSVTISDTNKCSSVKYFEVTQPDSLRIVIADSKDAHCFGYNDAFLKAEGHGGVGNYAYQWSTGETTALISNLYKGAYSLTLSDANKCVTNESFTINEPEKLEVDLGDDIKLCPGNKYTLDGQEFTTYKWFTTQATISNERFVAVGDPNDYYLEVTNSIGCFAWDTINLSIGNDALKADFLLSSQATLGDTLRIFELSNMALDSLKWNYNDRVFAMVNSMTDPDYLLFLKTLQSGIHNIDLTAFSGGCISVSTKQVEIIADNDTLPGDGNLGYKEPLIKSFTVSPNPTDGNFYATVQLREPADINLVMFAIVSSAKIDERTEHSMQDYSVGYNLSGLNSGFYLLILKAGNERKQVKIIIQR
ncbi:T9SS type A sorting domain-containing protein, partial [Williamwhitmania taraxaci]